MTKYFIKHYDKHSFQDNNNINHPLKYNTCSTYFITDGDNYVFVLVLELRLLNWFFYFLFPGRFFLSFYFVYNQIFEIFSTITFSMSYGLLSCARLLRLSSSPYTSKCSTKPLSLLLTFLTVVKANLPEYCT